jgi:hypothetical protein
MHFVFISLDKIQHITWRFIPPQVVVYHIYSHVQLHIFNSRGLKLNHTKKPRCRRWGALIGSFFKSCWTMSGSPYPRTLAFRVFYRYSRQWSCDVVGYQHIRVLCHLHLEGKDGGPLRQRQQSPPKRQYPTTSLHVVTTGLDWMFGVLGFDSQQALGIFLFTTASRTALGPTQPPIQWVPGALSLGVNRPGHEADHSPPCSAEVKEKVELYPHSSSTPSWRDAQLKHRDNLQDATWTDTRV